MFMEETMRNKRPREEEDSEDLPREKNPRLGEVGISDFFTNLASFSSEKSMVFSDDLDPWSFEDDHVSEIRGMAIRKEAYTEENHFNGVEEVGLEEKSGVVVEEELWRPQSPLCGGAEGLFGGPEYFMGANLGDARDSGFRIWEDSEESEEFGKDLGRCEDGIGFLYENDVADLSCHGTPLSQLPPCFESLEFKVSTPSL